MDLLRQVEDGFAAIEPAPLTVLLSELDVGLYELLTSPGPAHRLGKAITNMRPTEADSTSET